MKSKLKKPTEVTALTEAAYNSKLKTDLATLAEESKKQVPIPFLLRTEYLFNGKENTLLVVGFSNDWKKIIKSEGWLLSDSAKKTWIGTCLREGNKMKLVVKKGKLTNTLFTAAVKKNAALKKLKWEEVKVLEDSSDDDLLNEDALEQDDASVATNQEDKQKADGINEQLKQLIKALKNEASASKKKEILLAIDELADQLYAIPEWEVYTDDKIEEVLLQIETFLAGKNKEEQDEDAIKDKTKAKELEKKLMVLFEEHKSIEDAKEAKEHLIQIETFADLLFDIPQWQTYTDENLEQLLTKTKQTAEKNRLAEIELVLKKEQDIVDKVEDFKTKFYTAVEKDMTQANLAKHIAFMNAYLVEWQKLYNSMALKGLDVHAKHLTTFNKLSREVQDISATYEKIQTSLKAFYDAIDAKDKALAMQHWDAVSELLP